MINKIDTINPTITGTKSTEEWTTQVKMTLEATDNIGVKSIYCKELDLEMSGRKNTFVALNNGTYTFIAIDWAGNTSEEFEIVVNNIDVTIPSLDILIDGKGSLLNPILLSLKVTGIASGIKSIVKPDNSVVHSLDDAVYTVLTNGTYEYEVTSNTDVSSSQDILIDSIDNIPPTILVASNENLDNSEIGRAHV